MKIYFNELNKELPQAEIVDLFSSPLNIRSGNQLLFAINHYLINFKAVKNVAIVDFSPEGYHVRGILNERVNFTQLMSVSLPIRFIGMSKILISGDIMTIGTPIYEKDGFYQWLVLDIEKDQKDYVLNDLFFRFLENILIYKKTKDKEENLLLLASTDDVTGLYNQRKLAEDLEKAIVEHEEKHDTFSIMFIDLDHFKQVNDNYGHKIGDDVLIEFATVLSSSIRGTDSVFRFGGDEFSILIEDPAFTTNKVVAERIMRLVRNSPIMSKYNVTTSIGFTLTNSDDCQNEIFSRADKGLYKAKASGRNCAKAY